MKNDSLPDFDFESIDQIVNQIGNKKKHIIPLLNAVQNRYHYLPQKALSYLCTVTEITPALIKSVSTFYSMYQHTVSGKHRIRVCVGTACHVKGAENIFNAFKKELNIQAQTSTSPGGCFSIEKVECLGCCMLAPAVQIDDLIYGHLDNKKVSYVIEDFLKRKKDGLSLPGRFKTRQSKGVIKICTCSSCASAGAQDVFNEFKNQINNFNLPVSLNETGCTGLSVKAPLVSFSLNNNPVLHYSNVRVNDVIHLLKAHFNIGPVLSRVVLNYNSMLMKLYEGANGDNLTAHRFELNDYSNGFLPESQIHYVMRDSGIASPLDIGSYVQRDGFKALYKVIKDLQPVDVISDLKKSGLRGRGGSGYPTGEKWDTVYKCQDAQKYIICNGDEGDPGAFMDRMILESFPLQVLEGIIIAGFVLKAQSAFIYIRSEYPLALSRIREAVLLCEKENFLGNDIFHSGFSFSIEAVEGAGAFVCGEETALIQSIEGGRGMPQLKPPFPATSGLWGKPTLVNNVETFALITRIINHGYADFKKIGTSSSPGTKTFALAGKIKNGGLIEVPMGISLEKIIYDIGKGIQDDKTLKAVQIGGPSGGCIPASMINMPVDFDMLSKTGLMMGSGGLIILDESDCMVEIARYFMAFTQGQSCGKCTYCRIGTKQMLEILERITQGSGIDSDLERLETLSVQIKERSVCGLGKNAPNPVISTLKYFRDEYESHLKGICPAKKCKALISYRVTDNCIGCTRCFQICPTEAVSSQAFKKHWINQDKCIRCNACFQTCPQNAIEIEQGDFKPND